MIFKPTHKNIQFWMKQRGQNIIHFWNPNIPREVQSGHFHIVRYLINEQGCNPSCLDEHKYTPLHHAAISGHIDIVKFLTVEKYCDSMCKDFNQNTPLHMAAGKGHLEIAKFLILEECTPITELMNSLKYRWNNTPPSSQCSSDWPVGYSSILHLQSEV